MSSSLLDYYTERQFNPVPIALKKENQWDIHINKRINLLEKHLRIPIQLLKGKEVLEVGCNSGENALALAYFGAQLTLIEPNEQVHPQLHENFKSFGLNHQIKKICNQGLDDLELDKKYDLVIAEGFLNTLPNRDKLLSKLLKLCKDDGLLIINYDDRYGGYFELLKSYILKQVCNMMDIDFRTKSSQKLAKKLFGKSFSNLNTSRSFEAWWEDQLVNPFAACIWSLNEIIKIAEELSFEFYSSSPVFSNPNLFNWYKDVNYTKSTNDQMMDYWHESFVYILTGQNEEWKNFVPANEEIIHGVASHTTDIADIIFDDKIKNFSIDYPSEIKTFLNMQLSSQFHTISDELEMLYDVLKSNSSQQIISQYNNSTMLQNTWGTILHYICLKKNSLNIL